MPHATIGDLSSVGKLSGTMRTWIVLEDRQNNERIEGWEDQVWKKLEKEGKLYDESTGVYRTWIEVYRDEREVMSTAERVSAGLDWLNQFSQDLKKIEEEMKARGLISSSGALTDEDLRRIQEEKKRRQMNMIIWGGLGLAAVGGVLFFALK